ncbi:response regulator [Haliangium ochraceum]|uniref:Response regulator receiver protein n=1 Tax=Haliangium ochraceum (strain DSM 14365 / JCM 11303 / SMP-2) TaxID=502025 RepID=D0LHC7_HALO1|nr:response regulator [Haliangium ochraceum]ACY18272.1 response regulator receiver protein [Haliangium ochraceum DSM 14365]
MSEILIIEDQTDVLPTREVLRETLWSSQLRVIDDGSDALRYLRREAPYQAATRPALILLDGKLQGHGGHDLLLAIKGHPHMRSIPVILLSRSHDSAQIRQFYAMHANACIVRPSDAATFRNTIAAVVIFWLMTVKLPA